MWLWISVTFFTQSTNRANCFAFLFAFALFRWYSFFIWICYSCQHHALLYLFEKKAVEQNQYHQKREKRKTPISYHMNVEGWVLLASLSFQFHPRCPLTYKTLLPLTPPRLHLPPLKLLVVFNGLLSEHIHRGSNGVSIFHTKSAIFCALAPFQHENMLFFSFLSSCSSRKKRELA